MHFWQRGGGCVFSGDKNEEGKDNNDKDDKDAFNKDKVDVQAGVLHGYLSMGGEEATRGTMPSCQVRKR